MTLHHPTATLQKKEGNKGERSVNRGSVLEYWGVRCHLGSRCWKKKKTEPLEKGVRWEGGIQGRRNGERQGRAGVNGNYQKVTGKKKERGGGKKKARRLKGGTS